MPLDAQFEAACNEIRKFTKRPPDNDMLEVYALYKQAMVGNCNTAKPSGDVNAKAKWEAWSSKTGLESSKAKEEYVVKVKGLAPSYA